MPLASATAPSLADIHELAQTALANLPEKFRDACGPLVIRVADLADLSLLRATGVGDPFNLTGVYIGVALTQRSVMDIQTEPDSIWLFRKPILKEWIDRGDVALGDLVTHVLVHEIAHHFGYSDDDIAAIDQWWL